MSGVVRTFARGLPTKLLILLLLVIDVYPVFWLVSTSLKSTQDTDVADEYVVHFMDGGKLAIMSHRGTINGKPTYRSTHVWVKRGSNWELLQNHVSNIGEPTVATK